MSEDIRGAASGFVLSWTVLCGLGLAGGLAVGLGLAAPVEAVVGMMLVTPVTLGLAGAMVGGAQWLALGRSPRFGASWVATSGLGLGVGMTIGIVLVETLGQALTGDCRRARASTGRLNRRRGDTPAPAVSAPLHHLATGFPPSAGSSR